MAGCWCNRAKKMNSGPVDRVPTIRCWFMPQTWEKLRIWKPWELLNIWSAVENGFGWKSSKKFSPFCSVLDECYSQRDRKLEFYSVYSLKRSIGLRGTRQRLEEGRGYTLKTCIAVRASSFSIKTSTDHSLSRVLVHYYSGLPSTDRKLEDSTLRKVVNRPAGKEIWGTSEISGSLSKPFRNQHTVTSNQLLRISVINMSIKVRKTQRIE